MPYDSAVLNILHDGHSVGWILSGSDWASLWVCLTRVDDRYHVTLEAWPDTSDMPEAQPARYNIGDYSNPVDAYSYVQRQYSGDTKEIDAHIGTDVEVSYSLEDWLTEHPEYVGTEESL